MVPPSAEVEAEIADIALEPIVEQVPEPPKDTSPIQFMGGTLHDQPKNGDVLSYVESTGRTTLAPLPNRNTKGMPWRTRIHMDQADEVVLAPKALLRTTDEEVKAITSLAQEARADELIESIEGQSERITLIGQSADAQPAVVAVHRHPDRFKNLILAFPSGVAKKQKRSEYLRQAAAQVARGKATEPKPVIEPENDFSTPLPESPAELGRLTMRRFKASGGLRALASTMSGYQGGMLHELRQNEHIPGVSMVLGTRDAVGRPDKIIESLKSADDVDFLLIVNSSHGIKGRKDLMDRLLELTDMMEARTQARQAAKERGEEFEAGSLADRLIFLEDEAYRVSEEEKERLRALARQVPLV
jgi:pimeloyl-ACP methyl ester carboxylesterase